MIELTEGNLLKAPAEALVNTVNTEGVMGKGIALQFRQAFPDMYAAYERACKDRQVQLGKMQIYDLGGLVGGPQWIINFPTKGHWKAKSNLKDIETGLTDLVAQINRLGIKSIAVPPLGCGHGGLEWKDVKLLIESAFSNIPNVQVFLYPPTGTPAADSMPIRTVTPNMTEGRAALIALINRYLDGLLDPFVSLLEIHKLMYFMQEAGENLKLKFKPNHFGPYAENLRQVLIRLEGHFLHGYGAGEDTPSKPIEVDSKAISLANEFLKNRVATLTRMERVTELISGYETPYGMELLSTVHWVICNTPGAKDSAEITLKAVHAWNVRKRDSLKADHILQAWKHLKALGWDTESRSAIH